MNAMAESAITHSMGANGFKFLSTAGTATYNASKVCAIQALSNCTVSVTSVNGDDLTSVDIAAGAVIVGSFTSVTCAGTGGELLAYLSTRV